MSTAENRNKALDFAASVSGIYADWTKTAKDALNFLETGSFAPAALMPEPVAPRKPRTPKLDAAVAVAAIATAEVPPAQPAAVLVSVVAPAAAATPNKEPTLDDVRTALVQCQTRKGGKDVPQAILSKYSSNKTTGGLKKEDFIKVIAECASA